MGSDSILWSTLVAHNRYGLSTLGKAILPESRRNAYYLMYASVSEHDHPGPLSETGYDCTPAEVVKVIELMLSTLEIDSWSRLSGCLPFQLQLDPPSENGNPLERITSHGRHGLQLLRGCGHFLLVPGPTDVIVLI